MVFTVQLTPTMDACNDTLIGHQCNFTKKGKVLDLKDGESYPDSWLVFLILGGIVLIMGIVALIKRQAKLKERQRREEDYLAYFHSVLPQSQLYGKHEQAISVWRNINSHNGFNTSAKQMDMVKHYKEDFSAYDDKDDEMSLNKMFTVMTKYSLGDSLKESFGTDSVLNAGFHDEEDSYICDSIPGNNSTSELESESIFSVSGVSSAATEVTCIVHCEQDEKQEDHINDSVGKMQKMLTFTDLSKIQGNQQDLTSSASSSSKQKIYAVNDATKHPNTQNDLTLPSSSHYKEDIYADNAESETEADFTDREIQGILTFTNLTTNPNIRYNPSPSTAVQNAKPSTIKSEVFNAHKPYVETNTEDMQDKLRLPSNSDSGCHNDDSDTANFIWV